MQIADGFHLHQIPSETVKSIINSTVPVDIKIPKDTESSCTETIISETLVTDGYQPYHTLMKKGGGIQMAGCYAHARRKFAEIIKSCKEGHTPHSETGSCC